MKLRLKIATLLCSTLVVPMIANAANGNINYEARFDLVSQDNDFQKTGTPNQTALKASWFKIGATGELNKELTYSVKLFGTKSDVDSTGVKNRLNNTSSMIDEAKIVKVINDKLSFAVGKFFMGTGGVEGDYNGSDVYQYSYVGDSVNMSPTNDVGATVGYKFAEGQNLNLYTFNSTDNTAQGDMGYGVTYWGTFGNVKPVLSYHRAPITTKLINTEVAVGAKTTILSNYYLDLDFLQASRDNAPGSDKKDKETSIVGKVGVATGNFRPSLKAFFDTIKIADEKAAKRTGYEAVLAYYPKQDKDFNYHLAYTNVKTKDVTAAGNNNDFYNSTVAQVFAGIKLAADLL